MGAATKCEPIGLAGFAEETAALLRQAAAWTGPRVAEVAATWLKALGRPAGDDDPLRLLLTDLVGLFADYVERGDFGGYFDQVALAGRRYSGDGVQYRDLQQALTVWPEVSRSLLDRFVGEPRRRRRDLSLALDALAARTLATLTDSYCTTTLDERRALEAVTDTALASTDLDELLQTLLERIVEALRADGGVILLRNGSDGRPRPHAVCGLAADGVGTDGFAALVGADVSPEPVSKGCYPAGPAGSLEAAGLRSVLGAPLRSDGSVLGVVCIGGRQQDQFSAQEARLFETLADRAGVAIGRFRAYEQIQLQARALAEASAELQALDKLKTAFLATVSHELRTPLTAVMGYIDIVLRSSERLGSLDRHYLEVAGRNARELLRLINDLLGFAAVEAGQVEVAPAPVALAPIVTRLLTTMLPRFESKGVRLRWRVSQRLPLVMADAVRLQEALDAILTNALKFTDAGGTVAIRGEPVDVAGKSHEVVISVRDTGIGIPAGEVDRIWDRFYQVDASSTRRHGGMGLGLAIARRLVELQNGRIWAESRGTGKGTTFRIALPAARVGGRGTGARGQGAEHQTGGRT